MWQISQTFPELSAAEIQVCLVDLRHHSCTNFPWEDYLTQAEIIQFQKIIVPAERQVRTVARSLLRLLLAKHLSQDANNIDFVTNEYGKPTIAQETALTFNVSHCAPLLVVALTKETPVGIDVEFIRADFSYMNIAKRMFNEQMYQQLCQLPESKKIEGFFSMWTTVEAYLKGRGLSLAHYSKEMTCRLDIDLNYALDYPIVVGGIAPWEIYRLPYSHESVISLASPARKKISKWLYQPKLGI